MNPVKQFIIQVCLIKCYGFNFIQRIIFFIFVSKVCIGILSTEVGMQREPGNLVLRFSVLHFPNNFRNIVCCVVELNTIFCLSEKQKSIHLLHMLSVYLDLLTYLSICRLTYILYVSVPTRMHHNHFQFRALSRQSTALSSANYQKEKWGTEYLNTRFSLHTLL